MSTYSTKEVIINANTTDTYVTNNSTKQVDVLREPIPTTSGIKVVPTLMSVASLIIGSGISTTYYVRTEYYRAYDACTHQYYYVTDWYSNPNYTGYIDTSTSEIYETYLC